MFTKEDGGQMPETDINFPRENEEHKRNQAHAETGDARARRKLKTQKLGFPRSQKNGGIGKEKKNFSPRMVAKIITFSKSV